MFNVEALAPVESCMDFDPYNLGIPNLVLAGGGVKEINDATLAQQFFAEVEEKKPKHVLMSLGANVFRCTVATQSGPMLGMFLVAALGSTMMTAKIIITSQVDGSGEYTGITIAAEVM